MGLREKETVLEISSFEAVQSLPVHPFPCDKVTLRARMLDLCGSYSSS